ncbi:MAG TPA: hypothetical protein VI336_02300 [Candidatus Saccharimonadales bacterium]|nr:hypothetical protein [Candidatus Saccharimonadales bacterium]
MDEQKEQTLEESKKTRTAVQEAAEPERTKKSRIGAPRWHRFRGWYGSHKKWSIPATVLIFLITLLAIPATRYPLAGLALKKDLSIQVLDSKTNTPVSGALVSVGPIRSETDGSGWGKLHGVKVGNHTISITKKYYRDGQTKTLVPIFNQSNIPKVSLEATGRQVKVTVRNLITKQPIGNVDIKVVDIEAKTDDKGASTVVLPAGQSEQEATLSSAGYNEAKAKIQISDTEIKQNDLTLTPAGKIYFLSKLSGKIDVVKTNLDGTDRKKVLAGTGKEEPGSTTLLASPDQKYLILLAKRDSARHKLYIIDTSSDQLLTVDEGNASFEPVGWSGNHFVYQVERLDLSYKVTGKFKIKSYDATSGQLLTLVNSQVQDIPPIVHGYEVWITDIFPELKLAGNEVVYIKMQKEALSGGILSKAYKKEARDGVYSIGVGGKGSKTIKTWLDGKVSYLDLATYRPNILHVYKYGSTNEYYQLKNGALNSISKNQLPDGYNTYFISASGDQTLSDDYRDGKYSLIVGDATGDNQKTVATLSEYQAYGWYKDDYLLVSKDNSELYIIPKTGIKKDAEAIKISNYQAGNYYSYYE